MKIMYKTLNKAKEDDLALKTMNESILVKPLKSLSFAYKIVVTLPLISWTGFKYNSGGLIGFDFATLSEVDSNRVVYIVEQVFASLSGSS